MSKEDVLAVFERILMDPWAQRSGDFFEQEALKTSLTQEVIRLACEPEDALRVIK